MRGNDRIIAALNDVLTAELTAVNQYFVHARMCENWGYERLWKKVRAESIGEMKHADSLIERILYLEGVPNLQRLGKINVGQTVPEQLKLDLEVEKAAVKALNDGDRALPQPRRQRQPRAARADPRLRGRARQLDRGAAHADRSGRRGELPRPADPRRRLSRRVSRSSSRARPPGRAAAG